MACQAERYQSPRRRSHAAVAANHQVVTALKLFGPFPVRRHVDALGYIEPDLIA
jgi:hypothetical protein